MELAAPGLLFDDRSRGLEILDAARNMELPEVRDDLP